jgi:uncharacterized protein YjbI with pentapeptide repeats
MRAEFRGVKFSETIIDGLTLIKTQWLDCTIKSSHIKNSCLQRSRFNHCRIVSSSFMDFEALNAEIDQCVIAHSMFNISYGSGMNGFSGGRIRNCIFYNCMFEGYPLSGVKIENCVFIYCSGQIGEDMNCTNVAGIGIRGRAEHIPIKEGIEAERLLAKLRQK